MAKTTQHQTQHKVSEKHLNSYNVLIHLAVLQGVS